MFITEKLEMDLSKGGTLAQIDAVQGDKYSRSVELSLYSKGEKWDVPDDVVGVVNYLKPDGTAGSYNVLPDGQAACTAAGNVLTVVLAPQICAACGIVQLNISLVRGQEELNTFPVAVHVRPNPAAVEASEGYVRLAGVVTCGGWMPGMYLGTDESGNIVVKDAPEAGGSTVGLTVETVRTGEEPGEEEPGEGTVAVTGLNLDLTAYSAKIGDGFYINPAVIPANATNKTVTWESGATNIATVNSSGYVECIAEGDAVITCTTVDGGFTATCAVSVAAENEEEEVVLAAISVTYSGGDVPVGTAVTNLTGIGVTAVYTDGSTAPVTDYILSGTIGEGSNTVTVSHGGKTATFTVTGIAEPGDQKIQLSTLPRTDGFKKADGTVAALASTYHVQIPYTDGMFISTGTNATWKKEDYPCIVVLDGGTYTIPDYTAVGSSIGVGGKYPTQFTCTLTGFSSTASVYVSFLAGFKEGVNILEENMDGADIYYYIPGGAA